MRILTLINLLLLVANQIMGQNNGEWIRLHNIIVNRLSAGAGCANGKIYLIGGEGITGNSEINYLDIVEEYNPDTDEWIVKNNMPLPLSCFVTASLNNKIYIMGGQTVGFKDTNLVFEYDPGNDSWLQKSNAPQSFFLANAAVLDNKIYVGYGDHFYIFDPAINQWDSITLNDSLPGLNCLAVVNEKIWSVAGGKWGAEINEILEYDFNSNNWTKITEIPIARQEHSVAVINDKLYVIGGCNLIDLLINSFHVYDIKENLWSELQDLPAKVHFPAVLNFNGEIFMAGGSFGLNRFSGHQKAFYKYSPETTTGLLEDAITPDKFLLQNYPNPFNPSTVISYQLTAGCHVILKILNVLGNEIATLVNEVKPAGKHKLTFDASGLASGVYFYQLQAENIIQTKKMLLVF